MPATVPPTFATGPCPAATNNQVIEDEKPREIASEVAKRPKSFRNALVSPSRIFGTKDASITTPKAALLLPNSRVIAAMPATPRPVW